MGSRTDDHLSHSQYGAPTVGSVTPGEIADQLHGQLNAVERLQYQLTTHELQYAKQQARHQQIAADQAKVTVVSSSSSSETSPPSDRRETKGKWYHSTLTDGVFMLNTLKPSCIRIAA